MMKNILTYSLLLMLVAAARAELALETPVIEVKAKPVDEEVTSVFKFRNKGSKPVKILSLHSGCSCLKAELDKTVYAPGEEGSGTAVFSLGSFVGRHEKILQVMTDDPEQAEWEITFVLDIPEVVSIEPKTLQWWIGEEPTEKTTKMLILGDEPMKLLKLTSTRENVDFSWKEVKPGREYLISIKPKTTKEVTLGALKIETESKVPKFQRHLAFFSIFNKPADAAATPSDTK